MTRHPLARLLLLVLLGTLILNPAFGDDETSQNSDRLRRYLEQHPQADADGDGVLTLTEAQARHLARGGG